MKHPIHYWNIDNRAVPRDPETGITGWWTACGKLESFEYTEARRNKVTCPECLAKVPNVRKWELDWKNKSRILETGPDPHTVCNCRRETDAAMILRVLEIADGCQNIEARSAILTSQRNALLNAIEIAGFKLSLRSGLTLEIVPNDGTPDGQNTVILQNLPGEPKQ